MIYTRTTEPFTTTRMKKLVSISILLFLFSCEPGKPYARIQEEARQKRIEMYLNGEIPSIPGEMRSEHNPNKPPEGWKPYQYVN